MQLNIKNTDTEQITVEYGDKTIMLLPNETKSISIDSFEFSIKLHHLINDKFNTLWYVMNEIFTLEQMRTVLVVNGEYYIKRTCDNPTLKIRSQEFIFEKNTSYQTFVFSPDGCTVTRKQLEVANRAKILKRAKILYLFGGNKSFLPLTGIALIILLIDALSASAVPLWEIITLSLLSCCFILCLFNYFKALTRLNNASATSSILKYMASSRKEYRKFTDELVQQYRDVNAGEDRYL